MNAYQLLAVLLVTFICLVVPSTSAGRLKRLVNGEVAEENEFPGQISLQYRGNHHRGASILSSEWVLTCAHAVAPFSKSDISVLAGTNHLHQGGSVHQVEDIYIHPNFSFYTALHDIAVFKVSPPFSIDNTRQPITLPSNGQRTEVGEVGTVIGWGQTGDGEATSESLQKTTIHIVDHDNCTEIYNDFYYHISDTQICASDPQQGICFKDEGGPLIVNGVVVGLGSWFEDCSVPGKPSVFTQVSSYRSWIQETTGI